MFFNFFSCCFPNFPNNLKGVWYTSSMAPPRISGSILSAFLPPCLIIWFILCWAMLLISALGFLINPGAFFPTWLTVSLPAYENHICLNNHLFGFFFFDIFDVDFFVLVCTPGSTTKITKRLVFFNYNFVC